MLEYVLGRVIEVSAWCKGGQCLGVVTQSVLAGTTTGFYTSLSTTVARGMIIRDADAGAMLGKSKVSSG